MRGFPFTILVSALWLLIMSLPGAHAQDEGVDAAELSTVRVAVIIENGAQRSLFGTGSGFVVAPNLVVTNAHVVAASREQEGAGVAIVPPNGDGMIPARIVSFSALSDLALLEFRGGVRMQPLPISTADPRPGDAIIALGYPDVDDVQRSPDELLRPTTPSRTSGAIASLRDTAPTGDPVPTINHEAIISSGSSGGPLIDECGRVIGVNTWHARGRDTSESRGVATRASQLVEFLNDAGVHPTTVEQRCLSVAERVEAERASTVDALQNQNRLLATKLESADRLTRIALIILIGGTVALLVAVIVLAAILFGARHHAPRSAEHPDHPDHAEPQPHPIRRGAKGVLAVVAGATIAAVLVVAAGVALWRMRDLLDATSAPQAFAGAQTCTLDKDASRAPGDADDTDFTASGDLCVNGRTMYAPAADGRRYQRVLLNAGRLDVMTLDPRGRQFRRDRYALNDEAYAAALAAGGAAIQDGCSGAAAREAVAHRNSALLRFAQGEPAQTILWRCHAAEAPPQ